MRHASRFALAVLAASCGPSTPTPPTPPAPPQAFITVVENSIIGTSIKGTTSTSGCTKVVQVQVLDNGSFLVEGGTAPGAAFEIPAGLLVSRYNQKGIALPLTLAAKVVCDDGRTNTSQPVGVTFFPVVSVFEPPGGGQAVPDSFVAEGGLGGSATTFVGCVSTGTGLGLARVDAAGNVLAVNDALPFACSATSTITDKSPNRQTRWLMEPGSGAFAFNTALEVTATVTGKVTFIGVTRDGDAMLVQDQVPQDKLTRARSMPGAGVNPEVWSIPFSGIMNAAPVVDAPNDTVWASSWEYQAGGGVANIVAYKLYFSTGAQKAAPLSVLTQTYSNAIDTAITPYGAFNTDGTLFYIPLWGVNTAAGTVNSTVLACATNAGGCQGAARRWASQPFDGIISTVAPYGTGSLLFAAGPYQTWFLTTATGAVKSWADPVRATLPGGSLIVLGIQPGLGTDLFLLNGPVPPQDGLSFPTEVVAVDKADFGELYRFSYGAGTSPSGSIAMGIDEGGQAWFRVGTKLVKPQSLTAYRDARGSTPQP